MKTLKNVLPLLLLFFVTTAFGPAKVSMAGSNTSTEILIGQFYDLVDEEPPLYLITRIYGEEESPGNYTVTYAMSGNNTVSASGTVYESGGILYADVYVSKSSGTIHYVGELD